MTREPNRTCPDCGNRFYTEAILWRGRDVVPAASQCEPCWQTEEEAERKAKQRDAWIANRGRAGLPKKLWNVSRQPDGLTPTLTSWINGEIPVLVLSGNVGVGKTFAAAWTIWRAWQHREVRWVGVARAMGQLRAAFGDQDRANALRALTGDRSVVLDDIDKIPGTESGLSMLLAAIDARIAENAPLLVTMNSGIGELAGQIDRGKGGYLGEAIASRLSAGKVVELAGQDKRLRVAA